MVMTSSVPLCSGRSADSRVEWPPVPGKELVEPMSTMVVDATEDVGEPGLRIDVVETGGLDKRVHEGGRCPPRSDPANSHALRPGAIPRRARSAALLVRQMRPSSRKRVKA